MIMALTAVLMTTSNHHSAIRDEKMMLMIDRRVRKSIVTLSPA
jgi:hypothetical protein